MDTNGKLKSSDLDSELGLEFCSKCFFLKFGFILGELLLLFLALFCIKKANKLY